MHRLKAKRVLKRKNSRSSGPRNDATGYQESVVELEESSRLAKKVRRDPESRVSMARKDDQPTKGANGGGRQIISSLFSYNPKVNIENEVELAEKELHHEEMRT